jgi:hypothetical protein
LQSILTSSALITVISGMGTRSQLRESDSCDGGLIRKQLGIDQVVIKITTEVSSSPLVGSVIDALIDSRIEIDTKLASIDAGRSRSRISNHCSRHKPARPNRP